MAYEDPVVEEELYEIEVLDGEVVEPGMMLAHPRPTGRSLTWASPAVLQTAAVAATGFIAGAATLALLRRYATRASDAELLAEGLVPRSGAVPVRRGTTYIVHVRAVTPPQ